MDRSSNDEVDWAWEQHAKCVGHNASTQAPGPRTGGASWVTDSNGLSVGKTPETVQRAWIFGGVGLESSAVAGDVEECLLDPLVITPASSAAYQPVVVAQGLCDLWSHDRSGWHKYVAMSICCQHALRLCHIYCCRHPLHSLASTDPAPVVCPIQQAQRLFTFTEQRFRDSYGTAGKFFRHKLVRACCATMLLYL
jgi:hypothetical protein